MQFSIREILNLSVILLGLPFFLGFVYLEAYFGTFGITMSELQLSRQEIYVNAFHGLNHWLCAITRLSEAETCQVFVPSLRLGSPVPVLVFVLLGAAYLAWIAAMRPKAAPGKAARAAVAPPGARPWVLKLLKAAPAPDNSSAPKTKPRFSGIKVSLAILAFYIAALYSIWHLATTAGTFRAQQQIKVAPLVQLLPSDGAPDPLEAAGGPEGGAGGSQRLEIVTHRLILATPSTYFLMRRASGTRNFQTVRLPVTDERVLSVETAPRL